MAPCRFVRRKEEKGGVKKLDEFISEITAEISAREN